MLHGESNTGQASPRTPTQRAVQPQEAVQPQRNQTILQPDTPAQKAKYSCNWSHPTPHEADAHTSHVHKNAPSRAQSPGGRPHSTCTHRTSQPAEVADAMTIRTPPTSCQLTGPMAPLPINQKAKCLRQPGGGAGFGGRGGGGVKGVGGFTRVKLSLVTGSLRPWHA